MKFQNQAIVDHIAYLCTRCRTQHLFASSVALDATPVCFKRRDEFSAGGQIEKLADADADTTQALELVPMSNHRLWQPAALRPASAARRSSSPISSRTSQSNSCSSLSELISIRGVGADVMNVEPAAARQTSQLSNLTTSVEFVATLEADRCCIQCNTGSKQVLCAAPSTSISDVIDGGLALEFDFGLYLCCNCSHKALQWRQVPKSQQLETDNVTEHAEAFHTTEANIQRLAGSLEPQVKRLLQRRLPANTSPTIGFGKDADADTTQALELVPMSNHRLWQPAALRPASAARRGSSPISSRNSQ
jgi:hypothetical protein